VEELRKSNAPLEVVEGDDDDDEEQHFNEDDAGDVTMGGNVASSSSSSSSSAVATTTSKKNGVATLQSLLPNLPEQLPQDWQTNIEFLQKFHIVAFDIQLQEGRLVCPESGREFPVERGIPNMLLHDDEV